MIFDGAEDTVEQPRDACDVCGGVVGADVETQRNACKCEVRAVVASQREMLDRVALLPFLPAEVAVSLSTGTWIPPALPPKPVEDLRPAFEGNVAGSKRFVVAYRVSGGALDVLVWDTRRVGARVDLIACPFAGRLRMGSWRSRVGALPDAELKAIAKALGDLAASPPA